MSVFGGKAEMCWIKFKKIECWCENHPLDNSSERGDYWNQIKAFPLNFPDYLSGLALEELFSSHPWSALPVYSLM